VTASTVLGTFAVGLLVACSSSDETPTGAGGGAGTAGAGGAAGAGAGGASAAGRGGGAGAGSGGAESGGTANGGNAGAALGGASGAGENGGSAGVPVGTTNCQNNCRYVRAGALGSGDGSNWTNAYPELPETLERRYTYFIAAGTYPEYRFDDDTDGLTVIQIRRATDDNHGDVGDWDPEYGAGEATFGPLSFDTGSYDFDGAHATRVVGTFEGTVVSIDADAIVFRNSDVDGAFALTGMEHSDGACAGMSVSGDDVIVTGNRIHDAADDGVVVSASDGFEFEGNEVDSLHGCGTDGGCGPCDNGHSDGLEIYAVTNSRFVANFAHDIASTSTFFFGNWADELGDGAVDYCENILIANNILYNPETGFVAYIEDARGVRLHHNTIWGRHDGRYGGLAIGVDVTDLELLNNIVLSINFEHLGSAFDPAAHGGGHNLFGKSLGQWMDAPTDVVQNDPEFAGIPDGDGAEVDGARPEDFTPGATSAAKGIGDADANAGLPGVDFFGTERGSPPTAGAIE